MGKIGKNKAWIKSRGSNTLIPSTRASIDESQYVSEANAWQVHGKVHGKYTASAKEQESL